MHTDSSIWDNHYYTKKSLLAYPDENLVRMLKNYLLNKESHNKICALDLGCGSGRHMRLLADEGVKTIIGVDYSINALKICKNIYQFPLIQCDKKNLSIKTNFFDIVICWGSLHYCNKNIFYETIGEIYRILKKNGMLFAALRSEKDTFLNRGKDLGNSTWIIKNNDIKDSVVSFYSEDELVNSLRIFKSYKYGLMERTPLGEIKKIISHWFFWAKK